MLVSCVRGVCEGGKLLSLEFDILEWATRKGRSANDVTLIYGFMHKVCCAITMFRREDALVPSLSYSFCASRLWPEQYAAGLRAGKPVAQQPTAAGEPVTGRKLYDRLTRLVTKTFPELYKQHKGELDLGVVDASLTDRKLCFPHLHALAVLTQLLSDPSRSGPNSEHLDFTQSRANELSGGEFARELQAFLGPDKLMATLCIYIDKVRTRRRRSVSCSVAHQDELFGASCTGTVRLPVEVVQVANPSVSVTTQPRRSICKEWHGHSRVRVAMSATTPMLALETLHSVVVAC